MRVGGAIALAVAVGKKVERGRRGAGFVVGPVGLAAFRALSGLGGGDLVVVELQEVVGRCC
jgi:hypothetical protein